ncbi:putative NAD-specific glutamate dehydrogenase [Actibacterium atlanticum]|uniref:Putative NAD-specific glutamate dehydrogenase n=1 Tax=Actibacterium atlanticum TaxID=1461693 RepID=A0A058ZLP2_9RHOB|nr:putative NAD-specific glutamate dehydrogenase [Actibacterium atlanticum]
MLFHRLFGRMDQAFSLVAGFDLLTTILIGLGVGFGVLNHLFDVVVRQTARGLDGDRLLFAGAFVLGAHGHDAVGVNVEGHFDLRQTTRCRRDFFQVELAQNLVVCSHFALTLEHAQGHGVLVVFGGREDLRLLGRDRGVAVDQAGEHTAQGLDAQRQRSHVQQNHVFNVALQNTGLNGGAHGNHFVRVHAFVGLFTEKLGDLFDHFRHPGLTTDQYDLVDVVGRQTGVFQSSLTRLDRVLDQVVDQRFQLGTGQFHNHVQRCAGVRVHCDERLVDFGLLARGQFDFGFFSGFFQTLQGHLVLGQVSAVFLFELARQILNDAHVKVFTTQEGVAVGRFHFEQTVVDFQNGDIESTAAKVIYGDGFGFFLVQTVGQRSSGGFVDDAQHFQTGDFTGVFGGLALSVVEVSRNGDHGLGNVFAQIGFSGLFHLLQDEGRDLAGAVLFAVGFDPGVAVAAIHDGIGHVFLIFGNSRVVNAATDQAFHGEHGVCRVGDSLPFGRLADKAFTVSEADDRRRGTCAFGVFDNTGLRAVHDGNARVGGPEVDTDYFGHIFYLFIRRYFECGPRLRLPHSDPKRSGQGFPDRGSRRI